MRDSNRCFFVFAARNIGAKELNKDMPYKGVIRHGGQAVTMVPKEQMLGSKKSETTMHKNLNY